jgi:hypothetical protein
VTTTGWTELTTETELRALLGTPSGGAVRKERDHLHDLDLAVDRRVAVPADGDVGCRRDL